MMNNWSGQGPSSGLKPSISELEETASGATQILTFVLRSSAVNVDRSIDLSNRNTRRSRPDLYLYSELVRSKILLRSKNAARSLKRIGNLYTTMTASAKETLKTKVAIVGSGACAEFDRSIAVEDQHSRWSLLVSSLLVSCRAGGTHGCDLLRACQPGAGDVRGVVGQRDCRGGSADDDV